MKDKHGNVVIFTICVILNLTIEIVSKAQKYKIKTKIPSGAQIFSEFPMMQKLIMMLNTKIIVLIVQHYETRCGIRKIKCKETK